MSASGTQVAQFRSPQAPRLQGSVVVVEDDERLRALLGELLRPEGVTLRLAGTAREAAALIRQTAPALLIVDIMLPDGDGIAVLEDAQRLDPRIIGVVMTGAASVEQAVRAMKAGAADFLSKPMDNAAVLATVCRLLELHRLRGERAVLKQAAVRAGAVRIEQPPLHIFGEDGSLRGEDGMTEFERGVAEGRRRADEQFRHERTLLAEAVRRLDSVRTTLHERMEEETVALAFQIASKVLHDGAAACKDQIMIQAQDALKAASGVASAVLSVHPADAAALEEARASLVVPGEETSVKIAADPSVPRGTCLVHTDNRLIDASLDTQLLRLGEALKERDRHAAR